MIFLAVALALATLIIWQHFFYVKYRVQEAKVPDGANLYWWKRLTPPIEFGAMHAILFQMALLPLTMARQTVAALSNTYIGRKFVPLHKVVAMHVHLGYVMCGFVFAATIIFFTFFGQGCAQQRSGRNRHRMAFGLFVRNDERNHGHRSRDYGVFNSRCRDFMQTESNVKFLRTSLGICP